MRLRMLYYKACVVYELATLADKVFKALVRKHRAILEKRNKIMEEKYS